MRTFATLVAAAAIIVTGGVANANPRPVVPEDMCPNLAQVQGPLDRLHTWRWKVKTPVKGDCRALGGETQYQTEPRLTATWEPCYWNGVRWNVPCVHDAQHPYSTGGGDIPQHRFDGSFKMGDFNGDGYIDIVSLTHYRAHKMLGLP